MPAVNFYLKKADGIVPRSLIYLQFKYNNQKFVYSFGQRIDPKNWNHRLQRVKNNKMTTEDGQYSLNDLLDTLSKKCLKFYNDEIAHGVPHKSRLKALLDLVRNPANQQKAPDLMTLFDRFIAGDIKNRGKDKSKNTLQNYATVKGHLVKFVAAKRVPINFDTIGIDFLYSYTAFLRKELNLKQNTIAKDVTIIKTIMAEAIDLGYTDNIQFRHKKFTSPEENTDSVYLTAKEIEKLYDYDFSNNSRLEQVRDLFVVGCFTGLRYSDYSNVKPENIIDNDGQLFIKMMTQKTKELVIIPCNPVIQEIFNKYEMNPNRLPYAISSQKFNEYIKEAAKTAGLNEKGRLSTDPGKELWQNISSHTARRSFATNLYLEGFPAHELMKITGHKTDSSFRKYIKVTKLETALRLSEHIKRNWQAKLLRIVS